MNRVQGVIEFTGSCPFCGRHEKGLFIGEDYWCYCERHMVRWLSVQLTRPPPETDKAKWLENIAFLSDFEIVDAALPRPFHFPCLRWLFRLADSLSRVRGCGNPQLDKDCLIPVPPIPVWIPQPVKWDLWHIVDCVTEGKQAQDERSIEDAPPFHLVAATVRVREWLVQRVGR